MNKQISIARKTAYLSMLSSGAIILSYIETIIPITIVPIPAFKIGFANIMIMLTIYLFSPIDALIVNIARTIVISLLFSSVSAAIFSLVGGTLSILAMYLVSKCRAFSIYSVGIIGATMHNIGQILVAMILLKTTVVISYLPWLMLCSIICGIVIALMCAIILPQFEKILINKNRC